ncbi:MAG: hypothetical protein WBA57_17210 [Elainellaceae cyanobacterium]
MRKVMHKLLGLSTAVVAIASGQEFFAAPSGFAQSMPAVEMAQESAPSTAVDTPNMEVDTPNMADTPNMETPNMETPNSETPNSGSATISVTDPSAEPVVLNAGAEPRQMLRMTPTVGAEQRTIMDMTTEVAIAIDGLSQPSFTAPGTRLVMDSVVTDIDDAGLITLDFAYSDVQMNGDPGLPPQVMELMRSQISSMIGTTGTIVVDDQGATQSFTLVAPANAEPMVRASMEQMAQSFQQISSPFPAEAVGVGAVWQVPQEIVINGSAINSLATFELVEIEGDRIQLAVSIEQTGNISISDMLPIPDSVSVSDQSLTSTGAGRTFIDLNQMMPLGSDLTVNTQSTTTVTESGISATLSADVQLDMIIVSDDFELPTRASGVSSEDEVPVTLRR